MDEAPALRALKNSIELSHASPETQSHLARAMQPRHYAPRTVMFWEGDASITAFLIESGHVWLTSARPDGTSQFIADMGEGGLVGDHTALSARRRTVTATTRGMVTAWEIDIEALKGAMRRDAALAYRMLLSAVDLVVEKNIDTVIKAGMTTKQKLATVLLELGDREGGPGNAVIRLGQTELAMMIGVTRESVTRALASLREEGGIDRRGRDIVISDAMTLRRIAGIN